MKYRCHLCKYEEEVAGSATDGPIIVHSRILNVTAKYESSLVKNMADAEIRHVRKMHSGAEGQKKVNATMTLFGIEAEVPPDCESVRWLNAVGDMSELQGVFFEVLAATAAMKWREIYMAMEMDSPLGPKVEMSRRDEYWHARDQFRFWCEIRDKAVKEQRP